LARTTIVQLTDDIDDIDGSTAAETVRFAVDGRSYEIDLSTEHADNLRQSLAQFVTAARSTGRVNARVGHVRVRQGRPSGAGSSAVRAWAKENGVPVSDRGRIPEDVLAQYTSAQQATVAEPAPAEPAPAESGPAESVPAESGPAESEPAESVPNESMPNESMPNESMPAASVADKPKRSRRRRS
jgi:hypothetical protein